MKGILLLSGGIDSPVAGYLMLRQGVDVVALHMDARPHTDDAGFRKAVKLAERVGEAAGKEVRLYCAPNAAFHEAVARECRGKLHCILCKRFMYRVAEGIAGKEAADFIITGESLGQVASQTLDNLTVLGAASRIPVIRPLIGFDKEDTIKIARDIGTFELSSMKSGGCPFVPALPSTKARADEVLKEEGKIGLLDMVRQSVEAAGVP
jgi:tRNA uracil 4-sulfurtransferase